MPLLVNVLQVNMIMELLKIVKIVFITVVCVQALELETVLHVED